MRTITRAHLPMLALLTVGFLATPLQAQVGEDGYRLLESHGDTVKWGDRRLGVGASISYAFAAEALRMDDRRTWLAGAGNCGQLAPAETLLGEHLSMEVLARETAAAFHAWERAANLSFHQVTNAYDADIVIGAQGQPRRRAFANISYTTGSDTGVRAIDQALVCLNPEERWKVGFDGDENVYDIRYTLIHEIGHAIGLDHPGPSGQVMAFRYTEAFHDLQAGDLRGAQLLYGPARQHRETTANNTSTTGDSANDGAFGIGETRRTAQEAVMFNSALQAPAIRASGKALEVGAQ